MEVNSGSCASCSESDRTKEGYGTIAWQVGSADRVLKDEMLSAGRIGHVASDSTRRRTGDVHRQTRPLGREAVAGKAMVWVIAVDADAPLTVGRP